MEKDTMPPVEQNLGIREGAAISTTRQDLMAPVAEAGDEGRWSLPYWINMIRIDDVTPYQWIADGVDEKAQTQIK